MSRMGLAFAPDPVATGPRFCNCVVFAFHQLFDRALPCLLGLALWVLRGGETLDSALYPIALAIRLHRVHRVVVGCARLEAVHPNAENGKGMAWVQPYWRFRRLFQFCAIRSVADDTIMHR